MTLLNKIAAIKAEYPVELEQLDVPNLSFIRHDEGLSPYKQPIELNPFDLLKLVLKLKRELNALRESHETVINNLNKPLHLGSYDTPSPYDCGVRR